jgi:hypothetical protein
MQAAMKEMGIFCSLITAVQTGLLQHIEGVPRTGMALLKLKRTNYCRKRERHPKKQN